MKPSSPRAFALLLVPVLALGLVGTGNGSVTANAAASSSIRLQQLHMITPRYGWATAGHRVLRTRDGGRNWHTVLSISVGPRPQTAPIALTTLGLSSVWLAVPDTGKYCAVFRSFDGGSRWQLFFKTIASTACGMGVVSSFQFVTRSRGWLMATCCAAAGHVGHILFRTGDGGAHWKAVESNLPRRVTPGAIPNCDFQANVTFRSYIDGWATGQCGPAAQAESLYRTTDGGQTWAPRQFPAPPGWHICSSLDCNGYVFTYPPTFSGNFGSLPVSLAPKPALVLYSTANGGATWRPGTPLRVHTSSSLTGPMPVLASLNSSTVWALMNSRLYMTSDTGRHWQVVKNHPGLGASPVIQFVTSTAGFALSPGKNFIRETSDSGHNWHKVFTRFSD